MTTSVPPMTVMVTLELTRMQQVLRVAPALVMPSVIFLVRSLVVRGEAVEAVARRSIAAPT